MKVLVRARVVSLLSIVCAAASAGAPGGCGEPGAAATPRAGAEPVEVRLAPVVVAGLDRTIDVTGTLLGEEETTISAKVPGRVEAIAADLGDGALPGAVLARIEKRDYELALEERRTAVGAELARIGLTEAPAEPFDLSAVPSVARARSQAENAEARFRRAESLFAEDPPVISAQEHNDARTAWDVARGGAEVELLTARAVLAQARALDAQADAAAQRLADTTIRAPGREGDAAPRYRVAQRLASIGEYVREGTPLFRLVAGDVIRFRASVPERFAGRVKPGQPARVWVEAQADAAQGTVARLAPSIDPLSRTFLVEIAVPNREGRLKPGAFARGAIVTHRDEGVTLVPEAAIVTFAGVHRVFSVRDDKAVEHRVKLGDRWNGAVEIVGGLEASAVVVSGAAGLAGGSAVRAVGP